MNSGLAPLLFGRARPRFRGCQGMTPNGDAVLHLKHEAHGALDFFCGWRVAFEPGGNSTDEGLAHERATVKAPAAKIASEKPASQGCRTR
jgi:hypothetical protein